MGIVSEVPKIRLPHTPGGRVEEGGLGMPVPGVASAVFDLCGIPLVVVGAIRRGERFYAGAAGCTLCDRPAAGRGPSLRRTLSLQPGPAIVGSR